MDDHAEIDPYMVCGGRLRLLCDALLMGSSDVHIATEAERVTAGLGHPLCSALWHELLTAAKEQNHGAAPTLAQLVDEQIPWTRFESKLKDVRICCCACHSVFSLLLNSLLLLSHALLCSSSGMRLLGLLMKVSFGLTNLIVVP